MADLNEKLNQLQARLDKMVEYQEYFYREINQIRAEIKFLKANTTPIPPTQTQLKTAQENYVPPKQQTQPFPRATQERPRVEQQTQTANAPNFQTAQPRMNSGIEEFIGKNIFSLIGIIITIIGVGIGAKYAIDRDLISEGARIGLGYAFAGALFAVAIWLKSKYLTFSAVLLSGSLAIAYFLTFFAYSFYGLISQFPAFGLMVFITAFTVAAAIHFNRQVIAHIGLVGAYAVPFLLSENSGRVELLFGYMTVINFGILAISIKKFWKSLYYSSFIFTWLIYSAWFVFSYNPEAHFFFAFGFATVFFLTFYLTFLSYKLLAKEEFNAEIVSLVLANSFVFYGFGYAILKSKENTEVFLGLFTLANAVLNFLVAFIIRQYKLGDHKNFYLAIALAVTFVTIAVPVQFDGNWVMLIWTAEAAFLFYFGRTKQIALYENLSYPQMFLATASVFGIWANQLDSREAVTPFFNSNFVTVFIFVAAFGLINFVNRDKRFKASIDGLDQLLNFILPTVFLFGLYNVFRTEISNYFYGRFMNSAVQTEAMIVESSELITRKDDDLNTFNYVWQINYSMLFLAALSVVNIKRLRSAVLGFVNIGLNTLILLVFLTVGLYSLSVLRQHYVTQDEAEFFTRGAMHILVRYFSFAFVAALIGASFLYVKQEFLREKFPSFDFNLLFDLFTAFAVWCISSSELLNLADIFGFRDSSKLGLSILWGVYSLFLIVLGIIKRKAHLRIGAIIIFAVTLIKLFFYDIADLGTISKTVVFVALGVLLLIISFLYNKYKDLLFEKSQS